MSQQKYPKAYEAYQQAVYRDGRNPTFWCSIGVLYYQINQYRDALDAYSRAIRLNPYISEVWYDLGTLVSMIISQRHLCLRIAADRDPQYESCNNQINDALDAYQRAAELDPANVHIKARLQLLRNGQNNGMAAISNAPVPQDVHPNAYQPSGAVGPPGPQWGASAQQQAGPPGPPPGAPAASNWGNNRLADINPPTQPPGQFDERDAHRGPQQAPPRQPSPRQQEQQMRPYPEPPRYNGQAYRGPSPPRDHHALPGPYAAQGQGPPPPPPQQQLQAAAPSNGPQRVSNPNYGSSGAPPPNALPPAPNNGMNGPPPAQAQGPMPPFGRGNSPRPEVRPITDNRMASPSAPFQHQQYQPHPGTPQAGIANGAPPPAAALAAAEAAAMDRNHERQPSAPPKRMREWEDDVATPQKKAETDENRARMGDMHHRRPSTPPNDFRRSSSEARRAEEQRRVNEKYHPSEAAHHPHTHAVPQQQLPPMQGAGTPVRENLAHAPPPTAERKVDDRETERRSPRPFGSMHQGPPPPPNRRSPPQSHASQPSPPPPQAMSSGEPERAERAARKVDVNENYDDESGDEDKKGAPTSATSSGKASSPNGHANGFKPATTKVESPA